MILIFGGTTEGRIAADVCDKSGSMFYYSTKGNSQEVELQHGIRIAGAMNQDEMQAFCREHDIRCIVDAAHPFAVNLHQTIQKLALPVIRLQRQFDAPMEGVRYCADFADAARQMRQDDVHCLLALSGVNTISKLSAYWEDRETYFRILNRPESLDVVQENKFPADHLVYYNESCSLPDVSDERLLMERVGCDAILTKESGATGGFEAKVRAAQQLGLRIYVVKHPELPETWTYVDGAHSLRRAIEHLVPSFFPLKTGLTTGACATAAVKAGLLSLLYGEVCEDVHFALPDGEVLTVPVTVEGQGIASVIKDYSDDPDVTKGCRIQAKVEYGNQGIRFLRGEGVGVVTLPGLGIPVGEPAINPTPRQMIINEIRALSDADFDVTISIEHGKDIALRTFNSRVGVMDGLSVIGTSGIVSPLSHEAFVQSIEREIQVAKAIGCQEIGLVSGMKSEEALCQVQQIRCIHYGNFIGEALKAAYRNGIAHVVLAIMIGKAVKLAEGHLDTHSHKVVMNKEFLKSIASPEERDKIDGITMARELWNCMSSSFFERVQQLCHEHCKTVYPEGLLEIRLICDRQQ